MHLHFTGRTWRPHYEADSVIIQATSGCTYNQCRLVSAKCTARILDRRKSICQFGVELLPGHCVSAKGAVVGARCITARHRHSPEDIRLMRFLHAVPSDSAWSGCNTKFHVSFPFFIYFLIEKLYTAFL